MLSKGANKCSSTVRVPFIGTQKIEGVENKGDDVVFSRLWFFIIHSSSSILFAQSTRHRHSEMFKNALIKGELRMHMYERWMVNIWPQGVFQCSLQHAKIFRYIINNSILQLQFVGVCWQTWVPQNCQCKLENNLGLIVSIKSSVQWKRREISDWVWTTST